MNKSTDNILKQVFSDSIPKDQEERLNSFVKNFRPPAETEDKNWFPTFTNPLLIKRLTFTICSILIMAAGVQTRLKGSAYSLDKSIISMRSSRTAQYYIDRSRILKISSAEHTIYWERTDKKEFIVKTSSGHKYRGSEQEISVMLRKEMNTALSPSWLLNIIKKRSSTELQTIKKEGKLKGMKLQAGSFGTINISWEE